MVGKKLRIIRDGKIDRMFLDGVEINLEYHIKEVDIEGIEVTEQTNKG